MTVEDFEAALDVPFLFGLSAQGHIPTVQWLLRHGADWEQIGEVIGWHGPTAEKFYKRWLERQEGGGT
jgi:hypothetical protein